MRYTDQQRIEHMITTTHKLLDYLAVHRITPEQILSQEPLRWAITTPLYNIGEHAYFLSDTFKLANPQIPWSKISGLRHRLVHDYENTNWSLICVILFETLPAFLREIEQIDLNLRKSP